MSGCEHKNTFSDELSEVWTDCFRFRYYRKDNIPYQRITVDKYPDYRIYKCRRNVITSVAETLYDLLDRKVIEDPGNIISRFIKRAKAASGLRSVYAELSIERMTKDWEIKDMNDALEEALVLLAHKISELQIDFDRK